MFTAAEAQAAWEAWGLNCGPGALAAVLDIPLGTAREALVGFDQKRYTNPTMMRAALVTLGVKFDWQVRKHAYLPPIYGLARVQWEGPWTAAGVPPRVAYRHTHWIGGRVHAGEQQVFDINCMSAGGWVSFGTWQRAVVPWLLKQCEPKATGDWWITHLVEIVPPAGR